MVTLKAGSPLHLGEVVLVPVERMRVRSVSGDTGQWAGAVRDVAALVLRDPDGVRVISVDGSQRALEDLLLNVAGLDAALETKSGG